MIDGGKSVAVTEGSVPCWTARQDLSRPLSCCGIGWNENRSEAVVVAEKRGALGRVRLHQQNVLHHQSIEPPFVGGGHLERAVAGCEHEGSLVGQGICRMSRAPLLPQSGRQRDAV